MTLCMARTMASRIEVASAPVAHVCTLGIERHPLRHRCSCGYQWTIDFDFEGGVMNREPDAENVRRSQAMAEGFALARRGPPTGEPRCDPSLANDESPVAHDYEEIGEEYGSLGAGGSYWQLRCRACGRVAYRQMPD